VDKKLFLCFR